MSRDKHADPEGARRHDETEDAFVLLEILALGRRQLDDGQVESAADVIARLRTPSR